MVLMTMIARVADGLPLAATMQEDEQVRCLDSKSVTLYFRQFITKLTVFIFFVTPIKFLAVIFTMFSFLFLVTSEFQTLFIAQHCS